MATKAKAPAKAATKAPTKAASAKAQAAKPPAKQAAKPAAKPAALAKAAATKPAPKAAPKAPPKPAAKPAKAAKPASPAPAASGPAEGDTAPAFSLPATGGRTASTAALAGKPFVVYFYPKADTPGCTTEACDFSEALTQFKSLGIDVIGISKDAMPALEKFAAKYKLTFPLASDADQKVAAAYGTWVEKSMYGKTYMGMERSSFLVGADGKIAKVWRKVKPEEHAAQVIEAAKGLK